MLAFIQFPALKRPFLILNCSLCAAGASAVLGITEPAAAQSGNNGDSLTFFFDQSRFDTNSSANDPSNTKLGDYWLKAMFENDDTDTVLLTLTANLKEASGAFIKEVGFNLTNNFSGDISVAGNTCTQQPTQQPGDCQFDRDNVNMANGIKDLDLGIALPTDENGGRLEGTGQATFKITGSGLTAHTFDTLSTDGFLSAAKLQGYNNPPGGSSTIYAVPGPLPLLGLAAAFRASRRLRHRLTSARLVSGRPPAHRPA